MKIGELRTELENRKLDVSGSKAELVERLLQTVDGKQEAEEVEDKQPAKKQKKAADSSTSATAVASNAGSSGGGDVHQHLRDASWKKVLAAEFEKPYYKQIIQFLNSEHKAGKAVLPPAADIFNAFNFTPFDDVNVVIIGQDPYFNAGQAHGLCFSVQKGVKVPPSLATIYNELEESIPGFKRPNHGFLEKWAHQGVLLLNATLTVEQGKANSHQKCGWQTFTDTAIKALSDKKEGVVFLLWGGFAQKKGSLIDKKKHHILEAAHPSPLAGGKFKGCGCFKQTNEILQKAGKKVIDWKLDP